MSGPETGVRHVALTLFGSLAMLTACGDRSLQVEGAVDLATLVDLAASADLAPPTCTPTVIASGKNVSFAGDRVAIVDYDGNENQSMVRVMRLGDRVVERTLTFPGSVDEIDLSSKYLVVYVTDYSEFSYRISRVIRFDASTGEEMNREGPWDGPIVNRTDEIGRVAHWLGKLVLWTTQGDAQVLDPSEQSPHPEWFREGEITIVNAGTLYGLDVETGSTTTITQLPNDWLSIRHTHRYAAWSNYTTKRGAVFDRETKQQTDLWFMPDAIDGDWICGVATTASEKQLWLYNVQTGAKIVVPGDGVCRIEGMQVMFTRTEENQVLRCSIDAL